MEQHIAAPSLSTLTLQNTHARECHSLEYKRLKSDEDTIRRMCVCTALIRQMGKRMSKNISFENFFPCVYS